MQKKVLGCCAGVLVLFFVFPFCSLAGEYLLMDLLNQVENLNIQRNGYTLGKALDAGQVKIARSNPEEAALDNTYKFRDKNLFVVVQKKTNRVLVMYETVEKATQETVQGMIGDLYMIFDDPTVLAHDKVVYWAYTQNGKVSSKKFDTAKEEKKPLDILATIKFVSDVKIIEKQGKTNVGQAYYVISSDPVLKLLSASKT